MNLKLSALFICSTLLVCAQTSNISVKNLEINNKTDHFGASYLNKNQIVLTANATTKNGKVKKYKNVASFSLSQSEIGNEGELINIRPLKTSASLSSFNIASSTFSPDGKYVYITTNFKPKGVLANGKPKPMKLRIERGEYKEGKGWGNFKVLPFCDKNYSFGQPTASPDGKTLYFVSSMRGSLGRTDIYKVTILENNNYTKPERLSNSVNSRAKEVFPFVSADGYLYYSARKKEGMGRLDIYKCKILPNGDFGESQLLPAPINSAYDDYGYIVNPEAKTGYFSSNRRGGKGGEDMYSFSF